MPFAELSTGARLHYIDTGGDKTPVLLVHGLLGTASQEFPTVIEWLKDDYRVIGITLRGYGYSEPKPKTFPTAFYDVDAKDIVAFIEALNLPKCHLIGYSDGGEAALIAAGYASDKLLSVTSIGATGYMAPWIRDRVGVYPGDWVSEETIRLHGITDIKDLTRQWTDSFQGMIDAGGDLSMRNAHKISCPVLMLLGDGDRLNPSDAAEIYIEKVKDGRLVVVPDCGHNVFVQKWDTFKAEVGAHLKRAGGEN